MFKYAPPASAVKPLFAASQNPAVRALLAAGADPAAQDHNGNTPLAAAQKSNCPACVTLLQTALAQRPPASTP